jgi:hypothetical protein
METIEAACYCLPAVIGCFAIEHSVSPTPSKEFRLPSSLTPALAPTLTAGVLQINVQIPGNVPSGDQPVIVTVGTNISQGGLTASAT